MPLSPVPHVRGLVLAAGSGSRMGRPKALIRLRDGETLVERAVRTLEEGGCDGVTVVLGAAAEEVTALLSTRVSTPSTGRPAPEGALDLVVCADWAEGMGASLRTGLATLSEDPSVEAALVTLVDLPDVTSEVVRRLLETATSAHSTEPSTGGGRGLSRAAYGGVPGHPALIGRAHWEGVAAAARGDRGARDYFAAHEHDLVECGDLATGRDADTPADLDR